MFGKTLKSLLPLLMLFAGFANAQSRYTPSELDTLVATIALYPDPLLVHVLDASVYVEDIPRASAFASAHRNLKGDDLAYAIERAELEYDESVIALIPFPDVLRKMSKYATWTKQLGEAVDMQKADVMDAVQRMRRVAHKNGYLNSDDKVAVTVDENVAIQPVREEYVYVPEYDPRVVYYVVSDGNVRIRYVNGVWTGSSLIYWGWDPFYYDWVHRRPHYRHPHRYAPPPRHHVRPRPAPGPHYGNPPPRGRMNNPPPPPSNGLRKSATSDRRPSAPPPPSNYKRPAPPPPPQASSSDDDNRDSRRAERRSGPHNPPPPPRRGEGRRR
jgi:hypothetical protein